MKASLYLLLLVGLLPVVEGQERGEEPVLSADPEYRRSARGIPGMEREKTAWLGISISKPPAAIYPQLAGVPAGMGFFVDEVESGSPAAAAGLQKYDLLWKFEDQLLVNEGQMMTLLAMKRDGDRVVLTCFRAGKNVEVEVTIRTRVAPRAGDSELERVLTAGRIPGLPRMDVIVSERLAVVEDEEGVVKVTRHGDIYMWEAVTLDGELIARGSLGRPEAGKPLAFPEDTDPVLQRKLSALVRGYEQAAVRSRGETRMPRVRRVPTPEGAPER